MDGKGTCGRTGQGGICKRDRRAALYGGLHGEFGETQPSATDLGGRGGLRRLATARRGEILCSGAPFAVVLEDDVHLGRGLAEVLELDWTCWRFDVVKLETRLEEGWLSRSGDAVRGNPERSLRRLYSGNLGTAAYLLSAGGARKLLAVTREFVDPLDVVLFSDQAVRTSALTICQLHPAVAVQEELLARKTMTDSTLGGTIGEDRGDLRVKRNLSASAKIMRELRRPLNRLASAVDRTICRLRNPDREWRVIEFE